MKHADLLSLLDALPPFQVRLLAFDGRRPLTTSELEKRSGLHRSTLKRLARAETWLGYELRTIIKFCDACGVDLLRQKYSKQKFLRMMQSQKGPPHLSISTEHRRYWTSILTGETKWRGK